MKNYLSIWNNGTLEDPELTISVSTGIHHRKLYDIALTENVMASTLAGHILKQVDAADRRNLRSGMIRSLKSTFDNCDYVGCDDSRVTGFNITDNYIICLEYKNGLLSLKYVAGTNPIGLWEKEPIKHHNGHANVTNYVFRCGQIKYSDSKTRNDILINSIKNRTSKLHQNNIVIDQNIKMLEAENTKQKNQLIEYEMNIKKLEQALKDAQNAITSGDSELVPTAKVNIMNEYVRIAQHKGYSNIGDCIAAAPEFGGVVEPKPVETVPVEQADNSASDLLLKFWDKYQANESDINQDMSKSIESNKKTKSRLCQLQSKLGLSAEFGNNLDDQFHALANELGVRLPMADKVKTEVETTVRESGSELDIDSDELDRLLENS